MVVPYAYNAPSILSPKCIVNTLQAHAVQRCTCSALDRLTPSSAFNAIASSLYTCLPVHRRTTIPFDVLCHQSITGGDIAS